MESTIGKNIIMTVSGGSHEDSVNIEIKGIPKGVLIDFDELNAFLARRAPGSGPFSTQRKEADLPVFLQGFNETVTNGEPVIAIIKNTNIRPADYNLNLPRPSHADYTAFLKYGNQVNMSGGGPFSGRMTAPMCIAGGIALQILKLKKVEIQAKIHSIGKIKGGPHMMDEILKAKANDDSVGGIVECSVAGLPVGLGGPMFDGVESKLAALLFGIPAVKGVDFGAGFEASSMRGSEHNDAFYMEDDSVKTRTNNHGGILGGITSGMPLNLRVAFKPTPSIGIPQETVNLTEGINTIIKTKGRHDPCVVPRAVPVVEALVAIGILDLFLEEEWIK
ncbi:MAG: chorismate synthase [Peptostreptococcaceae bacterium]|nr:chorismate synthase [Peptostreptococcaceae bacterium]